MDWIVGLTSGVVSAVVVSGFFYWLASRDLRREVAELRRLSTETINLLEAKGIAQVTRDATGKPIELVAGDTLTISDKPTVVVRPLQPPTTT